MWDCIVDESRQWWTVVITPHLCCYGAALYQWSDAGF